MNSYKFTLSYDNNRDARNAAKTLAAYMAANGAPVAAKTVCYNGSKVNFVLEGNVSALTFAHMLEENCAVFAVEPIGDSQPLLVRSGIASDTHVHYVKA